jgi:hypothetical protein
MGNSEKKSLKSHLIVLITHVIKWYSQPWARSQSWINSILNARASIKKITIKFPSYIHLIDTFLPDACLKAVKEAENEIGFPPDCKNPSKDDLFDKDYELDE